MTFTHLMRILRVHIGLIMVTLIVVISFAATITIMMPRKYVAFSSIVIDFRNNPISTNALPAQLYPSYLATQLDIIASQSVALKVVDELKLLTNTKAQEQYFPSNAFADYLADLKEIVSDDLPRLFPNSVIDLSDRKQANAAAEDESSVRYQLAEQLLKHLQLKPSPDSSVLKVGYNAADPKAAADAANAFVRAYIATNLELNVNPARHSSEWFNDQTKVLADNLAKAREKYSAYQQQSGIIATDEHLDVESARLADLSSQLVGAQSDNHPGIQALKADLARAEAKLNNLPPQFGANHPQFRSAQAEVNSLRSKLASETHQISGAIQGQLGAQRARVLQMKKQRAELATLKSEVDNAQRVLDDASQRSNQVRMESQVNQTNVSIVRTAVAPRKPASPNVPINIGAAAFAAIVLAVGLALWRELARRYVRCKEDLKQLLGTPVLGVLPAAGNMSTRKLRLDQPSTARLTLNR